MKRLLELFCGTKSVGKVFQDKGYEVISLDYEKRFNPTIHTDILDWDYTIYPKNYFDVIWNSPDCSTFSIASRGKYRSITEPFGKDNEYKQQAELGNRLVDKVIEILNYFTPQYWFIENPKGLMRHYPPLKDFIKRGEHYKTLVYYANYGWKYPKPTDIWANVKMWEDEVPPVMNENTYKWRVDDVGRRRRYYFSYGDNKSKNRSIIPPKLIERIYTLINY
jgi:site-specific DNA-cytosine methylase